MRFSFQRRVSRFDSNEREGNGKGGERGRSKALAIGRIGRQFEGDYLTLVLLPIRARAFRAFRDRGQATGCRLWYRGLRVQSPSIAQL